MNIKQITNRKQNMISYIDIEDLAIVSFVVFTAQLTYSIINLEFGSTQLIVLSMSAGVMALCRDQEYITEPIGDVAEQISANKERFETKKRIAAEQLELKNHMADVDKIVEMHSDLLEKYNTLLNQRVDDEPITSEQDEPPCEHDYSKVILGYDDEVMRCKKCAHEHC
jgi:hypothetical protein